MCVYDVYQCVCAYVRVPLRVRVCAVSVFQVLYFLSRIYIRETARMV